MSATTRNQFIAAKGYDYEGLALDVYATHGDEGWELSAVKLAGHDTDLMPLLWNQIDYFDGVVERAEIAEARTERRERGMAGFAALVMGAPM
jgi:hypothetical protein